MVRTPGAFSAFTSLRKWNNLFSAKGIFRCPKKCRKKWFRHRRSFTSLSVFPIMWSPSCQVLSTTPPLKSLISSAGFLATMRTESLFHVQIAPTISPEQWKFGNKIINDITWMLCMHISFYFWFLPILLRCGTKKLGEKDKKYVHMLNATLCATGRAICCLLETYQVWWNIIVLLVKQFVNCHDECRRRMVFESQKF